MLNKLHNVVNAILGIDKIKETENMFRFILVNENDYDVVLSKGNEVILPIKKTRYNTLEYTLSEGIYYLKVFSDDNQIFYDEIYVSEDMNSRFKVLKIR